MVACRDTTAPDAERAATLESTLVPAEVVPPASFGIVAVYWRGACDAVRQRIVRESAGVRVSVFPQFAAPTGFACIARVSLDTIVLRIDAPYTLPFTARLERGGQPDTGLVVRRPAG